MCGRIIAFGPLFQANPTSGALPLLLDTYLKQLRMPTFVRNHLKFAEE